MNILAVLLSLLSATLILTQIWARARNQRIAHAPLAIVFGLLPGCEGCSPDQQPGPLTPDENTRFYVNDRLGSTALVTNLEGQVIGGEAHDPFGGRWVQWSDRERSLSVYGFTGKEHEPITGALAVGVRHYLPLLGRWASPDPLTLTAPGPTALAASERNGFSFAGNNPARAPDLNGLCVDCKVEHQIKSTWTPELRAAHARYQRRQAKQTARTLDQLDRVLNQLEAAAISCGPPGMVLAAAESMTLHAVVRGAALMVRAGKAASAGQKAARPVARAMGRAHNAADYNRLRKSLASEQQMSEIVSPSARTMAGAGHKKPINDIARLKSQYGGTTDDWSKIKSSNYKTTEGTRIEVHAYRNNASGQVVEPKTKITTDTK